MGQYRGWIKVDEIINQFLSETEQGESKRYKIFQIAFRGMEELGLDFFYQIKSVKLPVLSNKTVIIPDYCITYTKVGVLNDKGEVIPMRYNEKLTTYSSLLSTRLDKITDSTLGDVNINSPIFYNYWNGNGFVNLYGLPSGSPNVGTFKVDNNNGVIVFDPSFSYDYIILECIASPTQDGDYYVPIQFRAAMIAFMAWKDVQNMPSSRKGNLGDKRDRRHEFYNERRLAMARYRPIRLEQEYEQSLQNTRLTVKT